MNLLNQNRSQENLIKYTLSWKTTLVTKTVNYNKILLPCCCSCVTFITDAKRNNNFIQHLSLNISFLYMFEIFCE